MSRQDDKMLVEPTCMTSVGGEKRHSYWDVNVVISGVVKVQGRFKWCKAL